MPSGKGAASALSTLTLLLALGLSACGYQLRGYDSVPDGLRRVALQVDEGSALGRALERRMRARDIATDAAPDTSHRLILLSEQHERRAISLTRRAKTEEYELRSRARFEVRGANGKRLLGPETVAAERVYSYDSSSVTAKDAEESLLRAEMLNHLSDQILRQYLSLRQP